MANRKDDPFHFDEKDYEGVEYIPSKDAETLTDSQEQIVTKEKRKIKAKSHYKLFMGLTIGGCVVIVILMFVIVYSLFKPKNNIPNQNIVDNNNGSQVITPSTLETQALIIDIAGGKTIKFYDILSGSEEVLKIKQNIELKDKYGTNMTLAEFGTGDIVKIEKNPEDDEIVFMQGSADAWTLQGVSNMNVDIVEKGLTFNNNQYSYNQALMVLKAGENIDVKDINKADILTVKGYGNTVYVIQIEEGHGMLRFINGNRISDGYIDIDNSVSIALEEGSTITREFSSGVHRVVVTGSNIETYSQDVKVLDGQTVDVDLSIIQVKTGVLILTVSETNADVYIDGEKIDNARDPIVLDYGKYNLEINKDGFERYEREILITQPSHSLNVTLSRVVEIGSISIITDPVGADVYIDNAYIGIAPVEARVEYGDHTITVRKDGYNEIPPVPITIGQETYTYSVRLIPESSTSQDDSNNTENNDNTNEEPSIFD